MSLTGFIVQDYSRHKTDRALHLVLRFSHAPQRFTASSLLFAYACAFAPVVVDVPDFFIRTGSSGNTVCYSRLSERVPLNFRSVVYEGDALYTPGAGLGGDGSIAVTLYGRASDPDPESGDGVKCVTLSADDCEFSWTH